MARTMRILALAAAGLLAACAHRAPEIAVIDAPPPPAPPPPAPPQGYTASIVLPAIGADGGFRTINSGVSADELVWHLRAALNVAALGCRGADAATLTGDYNALLAANRPGLARAHAAMQARFAGVGVGWQDQFDREATRLYNFFAQPQAQAGFCAAAATLARDARAVRPDQLQSFAAMAVPALEAPFVDYYRQVASYRRALAGGPQLAMVTLSPPAPILAGPRLAYDSSVFRETGGVALALR